MKKSSKKPLLHARLGNKFAMGSSCTVSQRIWTPPHRRFGPPYQSFLMSIV